MEGRCRRRDTEIEGDASTSNTFPAGASNSKGICDYDHGTDRQDIAGGVYSRVHNDGGNGMHEAVEESKARID